MEGGVRIPTSVFNRISDEQDTITTGWDCLQWYVIIPLPAQSDSDAIANFSIATFTCSDKGDGKDAEIVIATSDGRIYWISGDGEQLSVGLGDFGRTKYGNRKIRADIIRITPQNLDSLETWWSNKRLYLRFAD
jgi:hypothetical protein